MPLGANSYGKSGIRLVRIARREGRHDVQDLTVAVRFEGDFAAAHVAGDNADVLPTDTMKNTVYALAKDRGVEEIEEFALALSDHFLGNNPPASRVDVTIEERLWDRLGWTAFEGSSNERRTARVSRSRSGAAVESGLKDLLILKSTHSGFSGFKRDAYTTLKETTDRILATSLTAAWSHASPAGPFAGSWGAVRRTMLDAFAAHESLSVQHTLYAMGEAALDGHPGLSEIRLTMPNKHHLLVDLSPFGRKNENDVFVATEEPYGLIEATVTRNAQRSDS
ncbi:MAG TPA: urate oxidase [Thermoanaerobaculia bacterium]|nr:urate oxidase [Thermoanaerobaculia bacterium]